MKTIVPNQQTGTAIEASSDVTLNSYDEAVSFFNIVKQRLQRVDHWHEIAGGISATFKVVDRNGANLDRAPQKGDYFKIDIPGPGSKTGAGFDWVVVEEVVDDSSDRDTERYGFRVRPTSNPQARSEDTAHFYSPESTSTFLVRRSGLVVSASVHDRNLKPNDQVDKAFDKVRDAVVGTAGLLGFSKVQWQQLADGLIAR